MRFEKLIKIEIDHRHGGRDGSDLTITFSIYLKSELFASFMKMAGFERAAVFILSNEMTARTRIWTRTISDPADSADLAGRV